MDHQATAAAVADHARSRYLQHELEPERLYHAINARQLLRLPAHEADTGRAEPNALALAAAGIGALAPREHAPRVELQVQQRSGLSHVRATVTIREATERGRLEQG
ncbi:MAG TPA: hypothetical protein VL172_13075, partial [Kofleriaceae bacterium]|nr:hypothetical protein [Kofleriaceae bacterium]